MPKTLLPVPESLAVALIHANWLLWSPNEGSPTCLEEKFILLCDWPSWGSLRFLTSPLLLFLGLALRWRPRNPSAFWSLVLKTFNSRENLIADRNKTIIFTSFDSSVCDDYQCPQCIICHHFSCYRVLNKYTSKIYTKITWKQLDNYSISLLKLHIQYIIKLMCEREKKENIMMNRELL